MNFITSFLGIPPFLCVVLFIGIMILSLSLTIRDVIAAYKGRDIVVDMFLEVSEYTGGKSGLYTRICQIGFIKRHREQIKERRIKEKMKDRAERFKRAMKDPKIQEGLKNGTILSVDFF